MLELVIEQGGESLVVSEDEGRSVGGLNDLGHGEGLAGASDAEQDLVALASAETGEELLDGAGLGSFRFVGGDELEVHGEIIRWKRRISEDKLGLPGKRIWFPTFGTKDVRRAKNGAQLPPLIAMKLR